jgi:hypothetical protein
MLLFIPVHAGAPAAIQPVSRHLHIVLREERSLDVCRDRKAQLGRDAICSAGRARLILKTYITPPPLADSAAG